jgi:hypothetical protein
MAKRAKDEAKWAIIREWDDWAPKHPDDAKIMNGMMFFTYLQKERPDLLEFKSSGDKWQDVHGWLLSDRRVKE